MAGEDFHDDEAADALDGAAPAHLAITARDIARGRPTAIACYALNFIFPFWAIPLLTRRNAFAVYHAKQCLALLIACMGAGIIGVLTIPLGCLGIPILMITIAAWFAFNFAGLARAARGEVRPLPVIGELAERLLAEIQVERPE
ncbi:hypothetical protein BH11PLA1_BH11PLA1_19390 [soil metagenome]